MFKCKNIRLINVYIESIKLINLVKELNDQVQGVLSEIDKELNFVLVDGFLLYMNLDVIKELDKIIFKVGRL
jgi:hypothetical protein